MGFTETGPGGDIMKVDLKVELNKKFDKLWFGLGYLQH